MEKKAARKSARAAAEAAFAEHKEISAMVASLDQWLDQPSDCARAWTDCLREQLAPLVTILEPHFADEETSPLYTDVPVESPRFAPSLDRLFGEHGAIVEELRSIAREASGTTGPPAAQIRELTLRTRRMIFTLKRHESEENEILQQAYWDDLSAAD
jgi:hypothetical protein